MEDSTTGALANKLWQKNNRDRDMKNFSGLENPLSSHCYASKSGEASEEVEYHTPRHTTRSRRESIPVAVADLPIVRHSSKVYRKELSKFLAPEYVHYAFTLPEGSGSIWSLLKSDMESLASDKDAISLNEATLLTFLSRFLSRQLMQVIEGNLQALVYSHHGLNYTLRRSKAAIGSSIIDGIREEAVEDDTPLAAFLGQVYEEGTGGEQEDDDSGDKAWQIVRSGKAKGNNRLVSYEGSRRGANTSDSRNAGYSGGISGAGGSSTAGGDSQGGASFGGTGGFGDDGHDDGRDFSSLKQKIIEVHLPSFVTLPQSDADRKLKVRDRSQLFKEKVKRWCGKLYDPHLHGTGLVSIFHGIRTSSLESFCLDGICPVAEGSEFCRMSAFYASNSVLHAFERPLHHKLGRYVGDFVSVLEFHVEIAILHGKKAPPCGSNKPFDIRWFPRPSEQWKRFCIGNMAVNPKLKALAPLHAHDIVIGPVCKPLDGGTNMGVVSERLESGDAYVCQIAFCTPRAWSWLKCCFRRVFEERRDVEAV